jgi:hypothetical protein
MAKRSKIPQSLRKRLLEQIDAEIEAAKEHVRIANDITDMLNLIDDGEPKVEKRGNVIVASFNSEAK